jgi:hypothetical protein
VTVQSGWETRRHLKAALPFKYVEFVEALVLRVMFLDVLPDAGVVSPNSGDVIGSRPRVMACEILPPVEITSRNADGTLPFREPDDRDP